MRKKKKKIRSLKEKLTQTLDSTHADSLFNVSEEEFKYIRKMIDGLAWLATFNQGNQTADTTVKTTSTPSEFSQEFKRFMQTWTEQGNRLEDILYIQAESPYCHVHTLRVGESMAELRLPIHQFPQDSLQVPLLRIHRRYLVNREKVLFLEKKNHMDWQIVLMDSNKELCFLPVGRSYIKAILADNPQWNRLLQN